MNIVCPCCAAEYPLDAGVNDAAARRVAALMGELPPAAAKLLPAYLRLHKPASQGLRWARAEALLAELVPAISAGQITRHGVAQAAPLPLWLTALQTVADKTDLRLPLKGHGLLFEIVSAAAVQAGARAEAARDARLRAGAPAASPLPPAGEGGAQRRVRPADAAPYDPVAAHLSHMQRLKAGRP